MTPQTDKTSFTLDEVMKMYGDSNRTKDIQPSIQAAQNNPYGATFRATGNENPLQAGLKATGNVPTSAYTMGKGLVSAVMHPIDTIMGASSLLSDVKNKVVYNPIKALTGIGTQKETPTLDALKESYFGKDGRYGSLENAQKTAIEDPFGVGTDILSIVSGGAGVAGKTATLEKVIGTVGSKTLSPAMNITSGFSDKVAKTLKFGISQSTGMAPETISTIANDRNAFTAAQKAGTTPTDLAENVLGAIKNAQSELSDVGSAYDTVRTSGTTVAMPDGWLQKSLDKYRLKVTETADAKNPNAPVQTKISSDRTSATRNTTDLNKIQEFVDNWGDAKNLTPEEYLNMRHDLAELAKYDMSGKSTVVRQFAQDVREGVLNSDAVRGQVSGLKELDTKYAADKTFLSKIEKDFIDPKTGNLKDGAASKVVNSINTANPERLARLEQLYPGFTKQARVVKALDDIDKSMGIKTGTYVRAGVGTTALLTGNIPVVIAAILSTPEIAVPLIKGYGWTAEKAAPVLKAVRDAASDINNFRSPANLEAYLKEKYPNGVPMGLSIEDVTKTKSFKEGANPETTLLDEAKKYKSAEEFVKANKQKEFSVLTNNIDAIEGTADKVWNKINKQIQNDPILKKMEYDDRLVLTLDHSHSTNSSYVTLTDNETGNDILKIRISDHSKPNFGSVIKEGELGSGIFDSVDELNKYVDGNIANDIYFLTKTRSQLADIWKEANGE